MTANACTNCGTAMPDGGLVSSGGEICQACYDATEATSRPMRSPLGAVVIVCVVLPFVFTLTINNLSLIHIGAGAVGLVAGTVSAITSAKREDLPPTTVALSAIGAAVCLFHLLRGFAVV